MYPSSAIDPVESRFLVKLGTYKTSPNYIPFALTVPLPLIERDSPPIVLMEDTSIASNFTKTLSSSVRCWVAPLSKYHFLLLKSILAICASMISKASAKFLHYQRSYQPSLQSLKNGLFCVLLLAVEIMLSILCSSA